MAFFDYKLLFMSIFKQNCTNSIFFEIKHGRFITQCTGLTSKKRTTVLQPVIIAILDAANDDAVDLSKICPPACTETKYSSSISTVPKENSKGESKVYVFFTDSSIVKFKRSGLYKITDIICKYDSCVHTVQSGFQSGLIRIQYNRENLSFYFI